MRIPLMCADREFSYLEPSAKGSLVESLCSNFAVLNPSITALSFAAGESNEDAAYMLQQMHSHRNALKIYSYFLHCILVVEEAAEPEPIEKSSRGKVRNRARLLFSCRLVYSTLLSEASTHQS